MIVLWHIRCRPGGLRWSRVILDIDLIESDWSGVEQRIVFSILLIVDDGSTRCLWSFDYWVGRGPLCLTPQCSSSRPNSSHQYAKTINISATVAITSDFQMNSIIYTSESWDPPPELARYKSMYYYYYYFLKTPGHWCKNHARSVVPLQQSHRTLVIPNSSWHYCHFLPRDAMHPRY